MTLAIEAVTNTRGELCWIVWGEPRDPDWPRMIGNPFE